MHTTTTGAAARGAGLFVAARKIGALVLFSSLALVAQAQWQSQDIGLSATAGSASSASGVYTLSSTSQGVGGVPFDHQSQYRGDQSYSIYGYADSFQFYSQPLADGGEVVARITGLTGPTTAQAGIMIRASADSSAEDASVYATAAGGLYAASRAAPWQYGSMGINETRFQSMTTSGVALPVWVKLVRGSGGVMTFTSADGVAWTELAWRTVSALQSTTIAGLAVASGNTSTSATATFDHVSVGPATTVIPPPPPPTGLTVTAYGPDYASLSWTNPAGLFDRIELQRSVDGVTFAADAVFNSPVPAGAASSTDSSLAPGTTYTFRIATIRGTTASYSNTVTVNTPAITLSVTNVWSTRVQLSWTCSLPPLGSFVVQHAAAGGSYLDRTLVDGSARTCYVDGLSPNSAYTFRVGGNSATFMPAGFSNEVAATTNTTPPPGSPVPPTNLRVTWFMEGFEVHLAWVDNSTDETGFLIEGSSDGVGYFTKGTVGANVTTFSTDMSGSYDHPSYYRVRAINANGMSDYATVTVTIPWVQQPVNLAATASSANRVDLTWTDASSNELGFEVMRGFTGQSIGQMVSVGTVGPNVTQFSDTTVAPQTGYAYAVRALAPGGGVSFATSYANVTTPASGGADAPYVTQITSNDYGPLGIGATMHFNVIFNTTVNVTGAPTLALTVGGVTRQAAYVGGSGNTYLQFSYAIGEGDNGQIVVTGPFALNGGTVRGTSGTNATLTFNPFPMIYAVADTTAPAVPVIATATATNPPVFSGTGEPGSVVSILQSASTGDITRAWARVQSDGTWTSTWTGGTVQGTTTFYATAADDAGNRSGQSASISVNIPAPVTPPSPLSAPVLDQVLAPAAPVETGTWNFVGRAPAGASVVVQLLAAPANSAPVGPLTVTPVKADQQGRWQQTVDIPSPAGNYSFAAKTIDANGQQTAVSASVDVTLGTPAPAVPVVSDATVSGQVGVAINPVQVQATGSPTGFQAPDLGGYGLAISSSGLITGNPTQVANAVAVQVTATNAGGTSSPARITLNLTAAPPPAVPLTLGSIIAPLSAGPDVPWTFTGTAPAGASIVVKLTAGPDGGPLPGGLVTTTPVTADASGNWTLVAHVSPLAGTFTFVAVQLDSNRNQVAFSSPGTVTVAPQTSPPVVTPPVVTPPIVTPPVTTPPVAKTTPSISFSSPVSGIIVGQPVTLGATSSAGLPITYTVVSGDASIDGNILTPLSTAPLVVRASTAGTDAFAAASTDVNFGNPQKAAQAITVATSGGATPAEKSVALNATTSSGLPVTYTVVSGPASVDGSTLTFTGTGTVVVRASQSGDARYAAASDVTLTFNAVPVNRLVNVSSRVFVSANDGSGASIAGFVVTGNSAKPMLIRAVGPGLAAFGVANPLAHPRIQLFDRNGQPVADNAGWNNDAAISAAADGVGAFKLASGSSDAALLANLAPGAYTAQVSSTGSGTALIEVYDVAANAAVPTKQLINISTRGFVGTGENALIEGFVVAGGSPKRVLVRAVGPGLTAFGVASVLGDPVLKVYDSQQNLVAQNDQWETGQPVTPTQVPATAAEITAANTAAGAFALTPGSKDAAVVLTLAPGAYTVITIGANGTTGAALVEVYELPDASP